MSTPKEKPSLAGPLVVWIIPQLAVLALAASRIKISAHFPSDGETLALPELLVMQIVVSSLLFPSLCRSFQSTGAMVCASLPFICLASYLSASPVLATFASASFLTLWMVGLALWCKVGKPEQLLAVAIIVTANIAGLLLAYVTFESGEQNLWWLRGIPLIAVVRIARGADYAGFSGVFLIGALALAANAATRVRISTSVTH